MTLLMNFPSVSNSAGGIAQTRHPFYSENISDWEKWRAAYDADDDFKQEYLVKLSKLETETELVERRKATYVPAFASAAINDIKNAIFQRTPDVVRVGGAKTYQICSRGDEGGVDFKSSSMGTFIGTEIIHELLVLTRVGVLVENFTSEDIGTTLLDKGNKHPYLITYPTEDILSWTYGADNKFDRLLLRETQETFNQYGLPVGENYIYRFYTRTGSGVNVKFYDDKDKVVAERLLDLKEIPFSLFEIPLSLMRNIADYQIALMNIESSDISFVMKSNFPFYYEYYDPKTDPPHLKGPANNGDTGIDTDYVSKQKEVSVGITKGRQFRKGLEKPGFVTPPSETLVASMEKGNQIKKDIRTLLNLNLQELDPRRQSAESKAQDQGGLENSLAYIGLVLQRGEQSILEHWSMYEGEGKGHVEYPKTYSVKSEEQRRQDAEELEKLSDKIPSPTFRKEVKKKVARTVLGPDIKREVIEKIHSEIDNAATLTADPNIILSSHKAGLVCDVTASDAIGFDGKKECEQAAEDRAKRIALTMEAQGGEGGAARGAPEFDKGQPDSSEEKTGKKQRGKADNTNQGSEQK